MEIFEEKRSVCWLIKKEIERQGPETESNDLCWQLTHKKLCVVSHIMNPRRAAAFFRLFSLFARSCVGFKSWNIRSHSRISVCDMNAWQARSRRVRVGYLGGMRDDVIVKQDLLSSGYFLSLSTLSFCSHCSLLWSKLESPIDQYSYLNCWGWFSIFSLEFHSSACVSCFSYYIFYFPFSELYDNIKTHELPLMTIDDGDLLLSKQNCLPLWW